ncbi:MAG: AsnC family transcriptional regulator [Peptococcaceae bacterium]|nr:AsnC family transcriptional regulator [Peptococcaceae bacterium]
MPETLDPLDKELLNIIQEGFPIVPEPYALLGERLGLSGADVLERLQRLVSLGIIRRLGPVFESRKLGYRGTLCAMTVPYDRLEEVAAIVNAFPGITHNYLREHRKNVWFTVLAAGNEELEEILSQIMDRTGINEILELPAEKVYKINVKFKID